MAGKKTVDESASEANKSMYSVKELSECAERVFGSKVRSECVVAAFKDAKKESATIGEARKIVAAFMKKEVK